MKLTTRFIQATPEKMNECSRSRHVLLSAIFPFLLALLPLATSSSTPIIAVKQLCRLGCHVQVEARREEEFLSFLSARSSGIFPSPGLVSSFLGCLWTTPPAGSIKNLTTQPKARQFLPCAEVPRLQLTVDIFSAKERGSIPRAATVPVASAVWRACCNFYHHTRGSGS